MCNTYEQVLCANPFFDGDGEAEAQKAFKQECPTDTDGKVHFCMKIYQNGECNGCGPVPKLAVLYVYTWCAVCCGAGAAMWDIVCARATLVMWLCVIV